VGMGREITWTQDKKMLKDEKTQKKKKNGTQWIFVGILILVMIEDVKG
jgi:predicted nucleic acid-binding Zn ribbon protein